jgi:hypothetical protein
MISHDLLAGKELNTDKSHFCHAADDVAFLKNKSFKIYTWSRTIKGM